ncbi:MAG: response regulator [Myxococcota bacterium]
MQHLFDIFRDPELPSEDDTRRAGVTMALLRTLLVGVVVVFVLGRFDPANDPLIAIAIYAPLSLGMAGCACLLHRGRVTEVAWGLVLVLWVFVAASLFALGGLAQHNGTTFIVCVMVAAKAIGPRAGIGLAIASAGISGVAVAFEVTGRLPEPLIPMTPYNSWLALVVPLAIATVVVLQSKALLDAFLVSERARVAELREAEQAADARARQAQILADLGHRAAAARGLGELLLDASPLLEAESGASIHVLVVDGDRLVPLWPPELANRTPAPVRSELRLDGPSVLGPEIDPSPLPPARAGRRWVIAPIAGSEGPQGLLALELEAGRARSHEDFVAAVASLMGAAGDREKGALRAIEAQKLEAVGRMAGAVAHDFNNLLTVILGGVAMLRFDAQDDPVLESIEGAGQRAALLTRQLLMFSHGRLPEPEVIDVSGIVRGAAPLLERMVGSSVRLVVEGRDSAVARASRVAIEQVLLNLVLNGSQAIGERPGTVTVRCTVDGDSVLLSVEDSGPGVPEAVRTEVFAPFFTTRSTGSGLGLATVRDIVVQLGGTVELRQDEGKGARFEVRIPRIADAPRFSDREPPDIGTRPVVLVVDDEPLVVRHVGELVRREGWTVHTASNGREARELIEGGLQPMVVLTDVVMPELDGVELAQWLRSTGSDVPIVLMSGWHDAQEAVNGLTGTVISLSKPFDRMRLIAALNRAIRA